MNQTITQGRTALRAALDVRRRLDVSKRDPICIYDVAERLGIEVVFHRANSLGGMFSKTTNAIIVPTLRPPGRQAFTCAHELGHWYFDHGNCIDKWEDIDRSDNEIPEERLVNLFAGYLLMPPWAIAEAFSRRGWSPATCTALQAYAIACQFGVGYETVIQHLRWSLQLLPAHQTERLLKTTPKQVRAELLGHDRTRHLVLADRFWEKVAVDFQVQDVAILPRDIRIEGSSVRILRSDAAGTVVEGVRPGIARASTDTEEWSAFLRICRKEFHGRSLHRHREDPDVDDAPRTDL